MTKRIATGRFPAGNYRWHLILGFVLGIMLAVTIGLAWLTGRAERVSPATQDTAPKVDGLRLRHQPSRGRNPVRLASSGEPGEAHDSS